MKNTLIIPDHLSDAQLLASFVRERTRSGELGEQYFAELLKRHGPWVHGIARRRLHDPHLAEDVTQAVFLLLAQKANHMRSETQLTGWLFTTTKYAVRTVQRQITRHQRRIHAASVVTLPNNSQETSQWVEIASRVDEALTRLSPADRNTLILRFYQDKEVREIGALLDMSESAVRKRLARGLDKLRKRLNLPELSTQNFALGLGGIGGVVGTTNPMPPELSSTLTKLVFGKSAVTGSVETITKGVTTMLIAAKVKLAATLLVGCITLGTTGVVVKTLASTPSPPTTPATQSVGNGTTSTVSAQTAEDALRAYVQALVDEKEPTVIGLFTGESPEEKQFIMECGPWAASLADFRKAVRSKFGNKINFARFGRTYGLLLLDDVRELPPTSTAWYSGLGPESLKIMLYPDTPSALEIRLIKQEGKWQIPVEDFLCYTAENASAEGRKKLVAINTRFCRLITQNLKDVTAEVYADKYKTGEEAVMEVCLRQSVGYEKNTPEQVLEQYNRSLLIENANDLISCFYAATNTEKKLLAVMSDNLHAEYAYRNVLRLKFGPKAIANVPAFVGGGGRKTPLPTTTEIQGDTAVVTQHPKNLENYKGKELSTYLVKVHGVWRLSLHDNVKLNWVRPNPAEENQMMEKLAVTLEKITTQLKEITKEIQSDQFISAQDAQTQLQQRIH